MAKLGWVDGVKIPIRKEDVSEEDTPSVPRLNHLRIVTDGCGGQYYCCQNQRGNAAFYADTESTVHHLIMPKGCFKGLHDGYGKDAQQSILQAVKYEQEIVHKVEDWAFLNATKLLVKPDNPESAFKEGEANRYIHIYYDADDFEGFEKERPLENAKQLNSIKSYYSFRAEHKIEKAAGDLDGYSIDCQKHVCFCKAPTGVCGHGAITGEYVNQTCHLNANVA